MKTYNEMVQFTVDQATQGRAMLRYNTWCAVILLSETYGKSQIDVSQDIKDGLDLHEKELKERRRAAHRASNEARRQANLAKKVATQ